MIDDARGFSSLSTPCQSQMCVCRLTRALESLASLNHQFRSTGKGTGLCHLPFTAASSPGHGILKKCKTCKAYVRWATCFLSFLSAYDFESESAVNENEVLMGCVSASIRSPVNELLRVQVCAQFICPVPLRGRLCHEGGSDTKGPTARVPIQGSGGVLQDEKKKKDV